MSVWYPTGVKIIYCPRMRKQREGKKEGREKPGISRDVASVFDGLMRILPAVMDVKESTETAPTRKWITDTWAVSLMAVFVSVVNECLET